MNEFTNNILQDIATEIREYSAINKGKTPSYIIINEKDTERLLKAMRKAKLVPDTNPPKKFILFSQRVIRTTDIPENNFDVVGG